MAGSNIPGMISQSSVLACPNSLTWRFNDGALVVLALSMNRLDDWRTLVGLVSAFDFADPDLKLGPQDQDLMHAVSSTQQLQITLYKFELNVPVPKYCSRLFIDCCYLKTS